jgi:hypothetical protein
VTVALGVEVSASVVFVVSLHPDPADGSIYAVIDGKAHLDGHIHSRGCGDGHAAAGHPRPAHGDSPINHVAGGDRGGLERGADAVRVGWPAP